MPRFLFQIVLERVRCGMGRQISRPLHAHFATSSARLTILPSVALSRSRMRLLTRSESLVLVLAMSLSFAEWVCVLSRLMGSLIFFDLRAKFLRKSPHRFQR